MHREERPFSIELTVSAEFPDDYEGDDDGYSWFEAFELLKPRLIAALFDAVRSDPNWRVISAPRGRDPDRAVEFELQRVVPGASGRR